MLVLALPLSLRSVQLIHLPAIVLQLFQFVFLQINIVSIYSSADGSVVDTAVRSDVYYML